MAKLSECLETKDTPAEESALVAQVEEDRETVSDDARQAGAVDYASKKYLILALVLLTFVAFANSLNGKFILDDVPMLLENVTLGRWDRETLKTVFTRDPWATFRPDLAGENLESIYYRPVITLFLMAGYELAGNDPDSSPLKWHLLVLSLHIISVLLCFLVLDKSLLLASDREERKRRLIAAFGAAVFAVHPAQSESIAWISGLVNPLSAITLLAALYCYLDYREKKRVAALAAGMILFAVTCLTKESAVAFVPIIAAYELFALNRASTPGARIKRAIEGALPFALVLIAYFVLRYSVLGVLVGRPANGNFPDDRSLTFIDNLRTLPVLLFGYLKIVLMPFNLSMLYDIGYTRSLGLGNFWLPLTVVLAVLAALVQACRKIPEASIAVIWITIPLLPHLNTRAFVSEELLHDRYLYIPLAGIGLLVALLLSRIVESARLRLNGAYVTKLSALVAVTLSLLTILQNMHWQDARAMWSQAAKMAPNTREVQYALGCIAEMEGDPQKALLHYDSALQIQPDMIDALNSSALVLGRARQWEEATRRFERIVELTPEKAIARFNLAFAYAAQRRYTEAIREQSKAISLDPNGPMSDQWRTMLAQIEKLSADKSPQSAAKN